MRIDVEKWVFAGPQDQKESFFEHAQNLGIIEFTSKGTSKLHFQHESVTEVVDALKILSRLPTFELPRKSLDLPAEKAVGRIIELHLQSERVGQKIRELQDEQERLAPFGKFSKFSIENLSKSLGFEASLVVFPMGLDKEKGYERLMLVHQHEGIGYGIWISPEPLPETLQLFRFEQDPHEIEKALYLAQAELKEIEHELFDLRSIKKSLEDLLFERMEQVHLVWSKGCSAQTLQGRLFYVEGWVPTDQVKALEKLLNEQHVWGHQVKIEEGETVPTCLKNGALGQIGEDLVGVYDIPSSSDKDPSLWVLGFFALFFSMIIGDGGYGLIFLLISLFIHFKFPSLEGIALRMKRLAMLLSVGCVFWGIVTCAFFAIPFEPSHPLRQASLLHQISLKKVAYHAKLGDETYREWEKAMPQIKGISADEPQKIVEAGYTGPKESANYTLISGVNDAILKEFALLIGAVHLMLSLARYALRTWASFGWMLFLVGGWLYFPEVVKATTFVNYLFGIDPAISTALGLQLVYLSLVIAFGLSIIQNKIYGLLEVMNLIQVFSDVLSYLRLYALGLAGGIMGATFNEIAASAGWFAGFFILAAGHLINITLAIIGGVVHGLRLNFLEWYHYSFSGAGRLFRPLKKIKESSR